MKCSRMTEILNYKFYFLSNIDFHFSLIKMSEDLLGILKED